MPEAVERGRTFEEDIRRVLSTLKFILPFFLLMHLVYCVVPRRSMIPHSAFADFFRNRPVDWMMDTPLPFGTPVECFIASNNSVDPRTGMGMVLGPEGIESGTHKIRDVRSDWWDERPVDAEFITIMNAKAAAGTTSAPDVEVRMMTWLWSLAKESLERKRGGDRRMSPGLRWRTKIPRQYTS